MTDHALDKLRHSGAALGVPIKVNGCTEAINDPSLKATADLRQAGDTGRLHRSTKASGIGASDTGIHKEDKAVCQVKSYKSGKITIGKTAR